jgi:hypothetical protein
LSKTYILSEKTKKKGGRKKKRSSDDDDDDDKDGDSECSKKKKRRNKLERAKLDNSEASSEDDSGIKPVKKSPKQRYVFYFFHTCFLAPSYGNYVASVVVR